MKMRNIDPLITKAVHNASLTVKGKYVDTVALAESLEISHEYLRARLRHMRGTPDLPTTLSIKIRWGKDTLPPEVVINAWRDSATVAGAARIAGLSRSGVLQRIAKLREAVGEDGELLYPGIQDRPHQTVSEEDRQAALHRAAQNVEG